MGNRTEDGSTVLATSKHRQRLREASGDQSKRGPVSFGISPDHPLLRLEYWPSRDAARNLINAIDEHIIRHYVPGAVIEHALWSAVPGNKEEQKKIKEVLSSVYGLSGWLVEFHNGIGERIVLRAAKDVNDQEARERAKAGK